MEIKNLRKKRSFFISQLESITVLKTCKFQLHFCIEVQNLTEDDCRNLIKLSGIKIIDFCEEQALITAKIIKQTKQYGLSLGDRGCIALAMFKNYTILTCDKIWQKVDLNVEFIMER